MAVTVLVFIAVTKSTDDEIARIGCGCCNRDREVAVWKIHLVAINSEEFKWKNSRLVVADKGQV